MANPQKENGNTQIANEILEAMVACHLTGCEFSLIVFVMRRTYGFQKKTDWISYTQFEKALGLCRSTVYRTITSLVARRLLVASRQLGRTIYGLNKDYSQWVVASRQLVAYRKPGSCVEENLLVAPTQPTKERLQKKLTKERNPYSPLFEKFWELYPTRKGKGEAWKLWQRLDSSERQVILSCLPEHTKQEQWVRDGGKFIPYPATWLNQRRWEDEIIRVQDRPKIII